MSSIYKDNYNTRHSVFGFSLPSVNSHGMKSVRYVGVKLWNDLPNLIKGTFCNESWGIRLKNDFKSKLKKHFLRVMTAVDEFVSPVH